MVEVVSKLHKLIKIGWCVLFSVIATEGNAQSRFFTDNGFENVRVIRDSAQWIITLENNARYPTWMAAQLSVNATKKLPKIDSVSIYRIIFLKEDVPYMELINTGWDWKAGYGFNTTWDRVKHIKPENRSTFKTDLVIYPELFYRCISLDRAYDVVVNISPAVELSFGRGWNFTGQVVVPLYNDYGKRYERVRPGIVSLSKQIRLPHRWFLSATAGLFSEERYGFDLKVFHPFNNQWAVDAQVGYTGFCSMAVDWECSRIQRLSGLVGVQYYERHTNMQFRASGGRFIYEDYGVQGECTRHFKHVSVGLWAQHTDRGGNNGGFIIAVALPPYKQKRKRGFRVTPAPSFRLTYSSGTDRYAGRMYRTHPSESEMNGSFHPSMLEWGGKNQ